MQASLINAKESGTKVLEEAWLSFGFVPVFASFTSLKRIATLAIGSISFLLATDMSQSLYLVGLDMELWKYLLTASVLVPIIPSVLIPELDGAYQAGRGLRRVYETACVLEAATLGILSLRFYRDIVSLLHAAIAAVAELDVFAARFSLENSLSSLT